MASPATTFSVLFGKQQLGFSVVQWDGKQYQNLAKQHVARRGPRIGSFLLQTLNEMQMQPQGSKRQGLSSPACLATAAICLAAKSRPPHAAGHYLKLFAIISTNAMPPRLPANLLHRRFIFRQITSRTCFKNGAIGFNEYLNHTRLEHAKTLLKGYDLKVKKWRTPAALSTATTSAVCFVKHRTLAVGISPAVPQPTDRKTDYSRIRWVCCGAESTLRTALITRCGSRRNA